MSEASSEPTLENAIRRLESLNDAARRIAGIASEVSNRLAYSNEPPQTSLGGGTEISPPKSDRIVNMLHETMYSIEQSLKATEKFFAEIHRKIGSRQ